MQADLTTARMILATGEGQVHHIRGDRVTCKATADDTCGEWEAFEIEAQPGGMRDHLLRVRRPGEEGEIGRDGKLGILHVRNMFSCGRVGKAGNVRQCISSKMCPETPAERTGPEARIE